MNHIPSNHPIQPFISVIALSKFINNYTSNELKQEQMMLQASRSKINGIYYLKLV